MTLPELRAFTRFLTNTNSVTYSDTDLDASLNTYVNIFTTDILDSMDEWDFSADTATTDLVTSQQEYILPLDILKIKRVEISYDGTTWNQANPRDVNENLEATSDTDIDSNFSTYSPFYDLMDNSIMLYPIPSAGVSAGLKIWYEKLPAVLTGTDTPTFAQPFHKGLSFGAAKDYFDKYLNIGANSTKSQGAMTNLEQYTGKMKAFYRKRNQDRKYTIEPSFVDYGYGDN